ncbi:MAG: hypothetical protein IJC17_06305 [Clostridia bacterium]|nr:hypothetical protein [Clostridia bacterium]
MKKTLRVMSVILSFAMLLGLLPMMGLSVSANNGDLYAGNGTFDDADAVAAVFGTAMSFSSEDANGETGSGSAYAELTGAFIGAVNKPVESGVLYDLQFKVKGTSNVTIFLANADNSVRMVHTNVMASGGAAGRYSTAIGDTGWNQVSFTFSIASTVARLELTAMESGKTVYIDDLSIVPHKHNYSGRNCASSYYKITTNGDTPWGTGVVQTCGAAKPLPENGDLYYGDGSFDSDTVSTVFGTSHFSYDNTVGYNGTGSAKRVLAETNFTTFSNTIESGKLYDLNFKVKGSGTGAIMYLRGNNANTIRILHMSILGANGAASTYSTAIGDTGWNQVSLTFSMPATSFDIQFTGLTSGGTIWIDDLTLAEHKHVANENYVCGVTAIRNDGDSTGAPADSAVCGADMTAFAGAQGVLSEDVCLDLYVGTSLTDALTVELNADDFANNIAQRDNLTLNVVDGKVGIKFPAKNMTDEFTATLKNGNTVLDTVTYSVKEYAETVIATGNAAAVKAAKALLNYGAAAQVEFGYNVSALANADLDAADQTVSADDILGVVEEGIDLTNIAANPDFEAAGGYNSYATAKEIVASGSSTHGNVLHVQKGGANTWLTLTEAMEMNVPYYISFQMKSTTEAGGSVEGSFAFDFIGASPNNNSSSGRVTIGATKGAVADADGYYTYTAKFTPAVEGLDNLQLQSSASNTSHVYIDNVVVRRQSAEEQANVFTSIKNNWSTAVADVTSAVDATYGDVVKITGTSGNANGNNIHVNANLVADTTYTFSADVRITDVADAAAKTPSFRFYVNGNDSDGHRSSTLTGAQDWAKFTFDFTAVSGKELLLQLFKLGTGDIIELANIVIMEKTEEVDPIDSYLATKTAAADYDAFVGYTLILRDTTAVRLYFNEEVTACSATGYTTGAAGDYYYVQLPAVKASALDDAATLTVTTASGTITLENFSALTPAALVVKANSDADLAKLCTALVLYAEAVNALA